MGHINELPISKINNIKMNKDMNTVLFTDTINGYMLFTIMSEELYIYGGIRDSLIDTDYSGKMSIIGVDMI